MMKRGIRSTKREELKAKQKLARTVARKGTRRERRNIKDSIDENKNKENALLRKVQKVSKQTSKTGMDYKGY